MLARFDRNPPWLPPTPESCFAAACASYGTARWRAAFFRRKTTRLEEKDKQDKARPWKALNKDGGQQLGYWGRYPETWEGELIKALNKSLFVNVIELMEHVLDKSEAFFEGAEAESNFLVFYGGLSHWHTPEAQAYMAPRRYANREMKITGSSRDKVQKRYRDKLVGGSPELCRGLDAHESSDSAALNCSLASFHPAGHPLWEAIYRLVRPAPFSWPWARSGSTFRRRAAGCWRAP